jgi:hypothetical protein
MATAKDIKGLKKYYRVTKNNKNKTYEFRCKYCATGWALPQDNHKIGNQLHLLNHAYSHVKNTDSESD